MNTTEYLEAVKKKYNLESDYKLSQKLNITRAAISKYKKKGTYLDNFTCYQVAEALGIEPQKVIIDIAIEKERNEDKRGFWLKKAREYSKAYSFFGAAFTTSIILKGIDSIGFFGDAVRYICLLC